MKRTKNIVLSVILAALMLFITAACGGGDDSDGGKSSGQIQTILVNSFEDYRTDIEPLVMGNYLGKVESNTDKTYVKAGEKSLKITTINDGFRGTSRPYLRQRLVVQKNGMNLSGFEQIVRFTADMYNDYDKDTELDIAFYFGASPHSTKHVLKANQWNAINIELNASLLSITKDVNKAKEIEFKFQVVPKDSQEIYLDNICLYKTQKAFEKINIQLEENEFLKFDNPLQIHYLSVTPINIQGDLVAPEFELTADYAAAMGTTGNGVLYTAIPPVNPVPDAEKWWHYPCVEFQKQIVLDSGFRNYEGADTFGFKVHLLTKGEFRLFIEVRNEANEKVFVDNFYFSQGQTVEFRKTFDEMNADWISKGGNRASGTGNTDRILLRYEASTTLETAQFVIDDMTFTKATKE